MDCMEQIRIHGVYFPSCAIAFSFGIIAYRLVLSYLVSLHKLDGSFLTFYHVGLRGVSKQLRKHVFFLILL